MASTDVQDNRFALVAQQVAPDSHLTQTRRLTGGVSANVHALHLIDRDGSARMLVIREHERTPTEFALLQALHGAGFAVPRVHHLDLTETIMAKPYLVMEFVDGSTEVDEDSVTSATSQMVRFLADLHALKLGELILPPLPDDDNPVIGALKHLPSSPENLLVRDALTSRSPWTTRNHPRLLHGDFWPGNVLWNQERLVSVIDWEDASIGDPLSDLAGSRVELLSQYGEATMRQFTNEYVDRSPVNTDDLAIWDLYASSAALNYMGEWGLKPADELHRRTMTSRFMKDAKQRVISDTL